MARSRLRELGIPIGQFPTGPQNAITDVPEVAVGHATLITDTPAVVRTGVTIVIPSPKIWNGSFFAGTHSFNGNGEMTGWVWLQEAGLLGAPIGITNTHQVGMVRDAIIQYAFRQGSQADWLLPVVAETWDGWLSASHTFPLTAEHVFAAFESANSGAVAEGNVGGGTGMICHDFKGGIGSSSRVVTVEGASYTVGVLVQTNYGTRRTFRVDGVPVGQKITEEHIPSAWINPESRSSIIVLIATDAPLIPIQCRRLAQRATVGLARVGGIGFNGSGDIFLAFSTANHIPAQPSGIQPIQMLPHEALDPLFEAAAEATEEAILNALCAAETMTGQLGRVAHALPLDTLVEVMGRR